MTELEKKAYAYATDRQKDPNFPVYNWETEIADAYEQGYKDAVDKACKWVEKFAYNSVVTDNIGEREKQAIVTSFKENMEEQQ